MNASPMTRPLDSTAVGHANVVRFCGEEESVAGGVSALVVVKAQAGLVTRWPGAASVNLAYALRHLTFALGKVSRGSET